MRTLPPSPVRPTKLPIPNPHNPFPTTNPKILPIPPFHPRMSLSLQSHAFAGNPLLSHAPKALPSEPSPDSKVLPFKKGRPLARSSESQGDSPPAWSLGWLPPSELGGSCSLGSFVYLGSVAEDEDVRRDCWAVDVDAGFEVESGGGSAFVELRTLMVATDWADRQTTDQLAIAGQAKALIEWHNISRFCGHCGACTTPIEAGRRKQCTVESCKKKIYPRLDPVVIMLVIDKENDRVLLSRQSRFVPRMWSCIAGFIEPGESLEEAVRREALEETGIEVDEVIYHSSQPWPVGPSSMPCQLMIGFFAYARSLEIRVDKMELEDAQWHSRDDVKRALTFTEYEKARRTSAFKVNNTCKGVGRSQSLSSDFSVESGELAPMFIPGPFAIAHHLISSWVNSDADYISKHSTSSNL